MGRRVDSVANNFANNIIHDYFQATNYTFCRRRVSEDESGIGNWTNLGGRHVDEFVDAAAAPAKEAAT